MPTHKFTLRQVLKAGLMLSLFLLPAAALAQSTGLSSGMQTGISTLTVYAISAMNLLTWIFFILMTILLNPDFIFNSQDGGTTFETVLNNIWILSRDLVNIGFALALIGTAIYTIVTAKKDFVAAHLKTFVMAVILVNFSWFVPRVIIDIGNVAAASIYGIPSLLQTEGVSERCHFKTSVNFGNNVACTELPAPPPANPGDPVPPTQYDCECALLANAKFFLDSNTAQALEGGGEWICPLGPIMCLYFVDLNSTTVSGHSAILNGLIVNHGRLVGLAGVPPINNSSEVGATIVFLLRQMIVLVIHAALFFPMAAMVAAFAIRIPVLWITIAFMPFAMLKFVLPGSYAEYPMKIWNAFLQAAMLPAMVAVPLAIGFILVNAGVQLGLGAETIVINMQVVDGVSNLFELLWLGITLGVLYSGVFMVLENVKFAAPATGFIKDMGKNLGGIAMKLPLSLPIIPGPGGKSISPLYIDNALKNFNSQLSNNPRGILGVADDIKNGNAGAFGGHAAAAGQFANGQSLHELRNVTSKLNELVNKSQTGGTPLDGAEISRVINSGLKEKIYIDQKNPESSLHSFRSELSKQPGIDKSVLAELDTSIGQLGTILRNQNSKP